MITLSYNPKTGETYTTYPDGHYTGCAPVPDDQYHAERLGITNKEHRLIHEAAHSLIGHYFRDGVCEYGCPILWRDSHGLEQPKPFSQYLEWKITAITYFTFNKLYEHNYFDAIGQIQEAGANPYEIAEKLIWVLEAVPYCREMQINDWLTFKTV